MFIVALVGFLASLIALVGLFASKYVELHRGVVVAPAIREHADKEAQKIKILFFVMFARVEKLPHDTLVFSHFLIHMSALVVARLARMAEEGAHRIADRVSHKHHFERNESNSAFLKTISEHKSTLTAPASSVHVELPLTPMSAPQLESMPEKRPQMRKKKESKPAGELEIAS